MIINAAQQENKKVCFVKWCKELQLSETKRYETIDVRFKSLFNLVYRFGKPCPNRGSTATTVCVYLLIFIGNLKMRSGGIKLSSKDKSVWRYVLKTLLILVFARG